MLEIDYKKFKNIEFGKDVKILANSISMGAGTKIGDNVVIEAENIDIGYDVVIEKNTTIKSLGVNPISRTPSMSNLTLGDNIFIGFSNQILVPEFCMLDFSQLHNSGLHSGYKKLSIGYNCWIGQHTILNSTEELKIKNNVRIGTQSQIWTHVASGELLEGCTLYGKKPVTINDDVWIVGGAVISPGLTLASKSIIMTGSVLTKSTLEKHTYAGVPAVDVTEKMSFWNDINIEDKFRMMNKFCKEFIHHFPHYENNIIFIKNEHHNSRYDSSKMQFENSKVQFEKGKLYITDNFYKNISYANTSKINYSIFNLATKSYIKTRQQIEIDFIKFCLGYRARFIPTTIFS